MTDLELLLGIMFGSIDAELQSATARGTGIVATIEVNGRAYRIQADPLERRTDAQTPLYPVPDSPCEDDGAAAHDRSGYSRRVPVSEPAGSPLRLAAVRRLAELRMDSTAPQEPGDGAAA